MDVTMVIWARAQFALTIFFHFIFVPITLGMTFIVAYMETLYYKTGNDEWKKIARFWQTLLAINFAIGIASGIIHEFEFGTNWSNYSWVMGDVFGAPLAVEGIMAFFMEASFAVVSFFGWKRASKRFHLFSTWMLAIGTNLSGLWIIVANSFMQHPTGYKLNIETARAEMVEFSKVVFQPKAIDTFLHQISSAYLLSASFVISISAYYLLKKRDIIFAKKSLAVAIPFAVINAFFLFLVGDMQASTVTKMQPTKIAAAEGLYKGEKGAPIYMGLLNPSKELGDDKTAVYGIPFPNMLSLLGKHSFDAFVPGMDDLVYGNKEHGILPSKELIRRGKLALASMKSYHEAKKEYPKAKKAYELVEKDKDRVSKELSKLKEAYSIVEKKYNLGKTNYNSAKEIFNKSQIAYKEVKENEKLENKNEELEKITILMNKNQAEMNKILVLVNKNEKEKNQAEEKMKKVQAEMDKINSLEARVKGLETEMYKQKEFFDKHSKYFGYGHLEKAQDIIPPVGLVFYSFHIMVGLGVFFMMFFPFLYYLLKKNNLMKYKWVLRLSTFLLLLSYISTFSGWVMAEVGRQPWTVFGVLPTGKSVTPIHLNNVRLTFFIFLTLFTVLIIAEIKLMLNQIKIGPKDIES